MVEKNRWTKTVEENPGHSTWYIERFKQLAAAGKDLHGEARMVDAMLPRGSRILDAGCGPGRVGGELAARGHTVVGVDGDPVLIAEAAAVYPDSTWLVQDLAELDLAAAGVPADFDLIVSPGNVVTFFALSTRVQALRNLGEALAADGRLVVGFGESHGYPYSEFFRDAEQAGLTLQLSLSTWGLRPWRPDAEFLVAILGRA